MSLETQLERLNDNLEALIEKLGANEVEAKPAAKKAAAKKPAAKKAAAKKPATKSRAKKPNYDKDIKPQVLIAIATPEGREQVKELLGEYGATKADQIEADDIPEFLEKVAEIIEENDDD